ncbi:bifunctional D12/D15 fatty acid desaturase [Immersiella caudata]|uniref:Bifunctional D12/D15 fatty acid desaturase n=1 Tax=Immersiella caudata TaxID=314043 RepID=A0AA39WYS0_9PEZI|nr:bifunctional D12/D15 fatty acid desaturase [Immersiella caudata]
MAPAATQTTTAVKRREAAAGSAGAAKLNLEAPSEPQYPDIQTIRDAIPAHCFQPSVLRSMSYVVRDLALITSLGWAALTYIPAIANTPLRWAAWIAYGYLQGLFCTGLWILAHECGHGAFSLHQTFNNIVGWAAHSVLMVPYFSWKFSHHRHHRFTGHMEKDMAFVPQTKENHKQPRLANLYLDPELFEDVPIVQLVKLVAHQLAGWQMYLLFNVSAGPASKQRDDAGWLRVSHFEPTSAVFRSNEALFIAISDLGLALTATALYFASTVVGWKTVFLMYGVPYFWVHHWLVAITYLHHNHPDVHHFDAKSWTFVKGALATVDRDFGFVGRHLFHGIIDTHVVHHLFPRIPFYYAEEATEAIKPVIGNHYHKETRSFIGQLWSTWKTCKYVEADPHVPGALIWGKN